MMLSGINSSRGCPFLKDQYVAFQMNNLGVGAPEEGAGVRACEVID